MNEKCKGLNPKAEQISVKFSVERLSLDDRPVCAVCMAPKSISGMEPKMCHFLVGDSFFQSCGACNGQRIARDIETNFRVPVPDCPLWKVEEVQAAYFPLYPYHTEE